MNCEQVTFWGLQSVCVCGQLGRIDGGVLCAVDTSGIVGSMCIDVELLNENETRKWKRVLRNGITER